MGISNSEKVFRALDHFRIELPSWGFANTGTRFGKFIQPAAATTTEEKFSDAGQVHLLTGVCPTVALHVLWDLPRWRARARTRSRNLPTVMAFGRDRSIPTSFRTRNTSTAHSAIPTPPFASRALQHTKDSIEIARRLNSRDVSMWFADGSNYPGTANIRQRKQWFKEASQRVACRALSGQRLLIEYKPFEPAFYHTDIADWGMALLLARAAGPQARVLVDTGHHYAAQNIEQIVAWLLVRRTCWAAFILTTAAMPMTT